MSAPAHTPGPWKAVQRTCDRDFIIVYDEGNWLATVWHDGDDEHTAADANLLAAAPDLLALAIQYRDDLRRPPSPDSVERRLRAINAAITKATGQ